MPSAPIVTFLSSIKRLGGLSGLNNQYTCIVKVGEKGKEEASTFMS
jgi:hypothetical protein